MKSTLVVTALLLLAPCVISGQEARLYADAEGRYAQGQHSVALALYDEYLRKYPDSERVSDVQYRRAVSLFRMERYQESLDLLERIRQSYRSTRYLAYVPFWEGVAHYSLGSHEDAIRFLSEYLSGPTDADLAAQARTYKAVAEVALDRLEEARATLQELDGEPTGGYPAVLRAYVLLRQGRNDDLVSYTSQIDPATFDAVWRERFLLYRAEALWETGRIEAAEEIFRGLQDSGPEIATVALRRLFLGAARRNDVTGMEDLVQVAERRFAASPDVLADMWVRLGVENYQRGSLDLAESVLRRVWNLRAARSVGSVVALHLAEIYRERSEVPRAVAILEESIGLGQEPTAPVVMRLGDLALGGSDFERAAGWYGRFLTEFPDDPRRPEAVYLLAFSRSRLGLDAQALQGAAEYLAGADTRYRHDAERLRALMLRRLGRTAEAATALEQMVRDSPEDVRARLDLLKMLFELERYPALLTAAEILFRTFGALERDDPYAYLLGRYLQGLALISAGRYEEAQRSFAAIQSARAVEVGLESIVPDLLYYHGWSLYRLGLFDDAVARFRAAVDAYPEHTGRWRALYMAAYSSYAGGRSSTAADLFRRVGDAGGDRTLAERSAFYLAKSLLNAGDRTGALAAFETFVGRHPGSDLVDDALLDIGVSQSEAGLVDRALETFGRVTRDIPSSPLAEEAAYQSAQAMFRAKRWTLSRDAFAAFRNAYPRSKLYDAALYWGGQASLEAGERLGAQLLWEQKLIPDFPSSPFRPDAMWRSAQMAAETGDYEKALRLTVQLMTDHPEQARALGAVERAGELRYLILGLGEREAELSAVIERERGVATRAGREALIALARIYLSGDARKLDLAYQMLAQIVDRAPTDERATADTAQYLVGEYFFRKNDPVRARDEFLKTALRDPADRDLAAASIYRAAEMSALTGRREDIVSLVRRLEESFPGTSWAQEGKQLLEETP